MLEWWMSRYDLARVTKGIFLVTWNAGSKVNTMATNTTEPIKSSILCMPSHKRLYATPIAHTHKVAAER